MGSVPLPCILEMMDNVSNLWIFDNIIYKLLIFSKQIY